jgi:uncharacterized protein YecE (DUF72 family)
VKKVPDDFTFCPKMSRFLTHIKRLKDPEEQELRKQKGYSFAMEGRHETWLSKESLDLMTKYDIAFVISQSGAGFPYGEHVTSKNIYLRFHGPGKLYASLYDNDVMYEFAGKIKKWKGQGHTIWVYFNNDYFGYGIENGKTLASMLVY